MLIITLLSLVSSCTYTSEFTPCSNNKRSGLITPQNCSSPSPTLITPLDCSFQCLPGEYISLDPTSKSQKCSKCASGTYSIGGGQVINSKNFYKHKIFSYCWVLKQTGWEFDKKCIPWHTLEDEFLVSGRSSNNNWYETSLGMFTNIVKPGSIHITYRKESKVQPKEDPGEFMIFVDDSLKFMDFSREKLNWYSVSVPLTVGPHEIEFVFNSFVTDEVNEVQIKEIQIRGTQFASLACEMCMKGSNSPGSDSCIECGIGSYLEDNSCVLCPSGTSSLEGSIGIESCQKLVKCGQEDFHYSFSECVEGIRMKIFEWNFPLMCDNEGISLPDPENVECAGCSKGMIKKGKKCEHCPHGYFLASDQEECIECASGGYAPKFSFYSEWEEVPKGFITACTTQNLYECDYSWEARSTYIVSSPYYQAGWSVHLIKTTQVSQHDAYVMFHFEIIGNVQLSVSIDGVLVSSVNDTETRDLKIQLDEGERQIKWTCKHSGLTDEKCIIHEILIYGSEEGGAINCVNCADGYFSTGKQDECQPCEQGFTSSEGRNSCVQCANNTYSNQPGVCQACPVPTVSEEQSKYCKMPAEFEISNRKFMLTQLVGTNGRSEYCSEPNLELSCFQTFFGPVQDQDDFFYISVGQPSVPNLPTFPSASKKNSYVFAVLKKSDLTVEDQNIIKPNNTCNFDYTRIIINLGSVIEDFGLTEDGFKLNYAQGDYCSKTEKFEAEVEFYCDSNEVEGWPVFVNRTGCKYYFLWPTRHACSICDESQTVYKKGSCEDGHRTVHTMSNYSCVFEDFSFIKVSKEKCSSGPFYVKSIFIIGCVVLALMLFSVVLLCYYTVKTKIRYQKLDTMEDSASIASEDASPRTPDVLMKKLRGRFPGLQQGGFK